MSLKKLSKKEKIVIFQCLNAAANGPFFPDADFHILFGLKRIEVFKIINDWPNIDDSDKKVRLAINNSINNLLGYPHNCDDIWYDYISVSSSKLEIIYKKWASFIRG